MERTCAVCGGDYRVRPFGYDDGACPDCRPGFFSLPVFWEASPRGTRALCRLVIAIHALLFLFFGMLLGGGEPGMVYCSTVVVYLLVRVFLTARRGKVPVLSRLQKIALLVLPFYGYPLTLLAVYAGQAIRYPSMRGWLSL